MISELVFVALVSQKNLFESLAFEEGTACQDDVKYDPSAKNV